MAVLRACGVTDHYQVPEHEQTAACEGGWCKYCCGNGGPSVYFCDFCLLPNCGFGECIRKRKREGQK
jgi:hypothetical protein